MAIDSLTTGDGAVIPDAYGEHVVQGHLFYSNPPTFGVLLGEGIWAEVVKVWFRGEPLTAEEYHFHPGTQSTSTTDPVQGIDTFLPGAITYNRTAYLVAKPTIADVESAATDLIGRYKCRLVPDFDAEGNQTGSTYSSNPARILIGLMVINAKIPATRIDWASWYDWKVYCDTPIEWNDGTTVRQIKRFESHVAFTGPLTIIDALNMLTDMSASYWQDDGHLIHFFPVAARSSILTLDRTNIVQGSFSHIPIDVRSQPTRIVINFRDLDNEYLAPAVWVQRDEPAIDQRGTIDAGTLSFGAMYYSQAQRLAKYWLRRAQGRHRFNLTLTGEHINLLPGDLVTLDYSPAVPAPVLCHIQAIEDAAGGADNRLLSLAPWTATYSDLDHEIIPKQVTT